MSEPLTFLMGKHPAPLPGDLRYCKNHMWCRPAADGTARFGFTAYALRLMQDVYFLEWAVDAGTTVAAKEKIGYVETSKAQSELYAPVAGAVTAFNPAVVADPSAVNADGYGDGWLFELRCGPADTLDAAGYHAHLAAGWENTQRMLKGQINAAANDDE